MYSVYLVMMYSSAKGRRMGRGRRRGRGRRGIKGMRSEKEGGDI